MLSPGLLALVMPDDKKLIETRVCFLCPQSCYLSPSLFMCMQSSPVHRLELREVSHSLQYEGRVGYSLQKLFMENELMRREI